MVNALFMKMDFFFWRVFFRVQFLLFIYGHSLGKYGKYMVRRIEIDLINVIELIKIGKYFSFPLEMVCSCNIFFQCCKYKLLLFSMPNKENPLYFILEMLCVCVKTLKICFKIFN